MYNWKEQIVFLIENEDGEKFGYYLHTEIKLEAHRKQMVTDSKSFQFNLFSKGRIENAIKFEILDTYKGGYKLFKKSHYHLIRLGDILLNKDNWKEHSECGQDDDLFNYHTIPKALCGKTYQELFTPTRILVIQMK